MNITLGNGKAVHATDGTGQSICHGEAVRTSRGTRVLKAHVTEAAVTCKRCAASAPAPVQAPTPVTVPAGHIRCDECGEHVPANFKAIDAHAADCF